MSMKQSLQRIRLTVKTIPQRIIRFISGAVIRIFGLTDDNYPATGVQPYEGDPSEKKML